MFDKDKWKEIFDSLRRHKLRTFLTALAVWWGIFMLVFLLGAGNGLQNSFNKNFNDDATNSIFIWNGKTSKPYQGLPPGRWVQFDDRGYDMLKDIPNTEYVTGRFYFWGEFGVKYKNKVMSYDVRAVHPDHLHLENTLMETGRYINEKDIEETRKICVIGQIIVDELFEGEDPIGKYINMKNVEYKVVGTYKDEGHENEMRKVYLPITTAQRIEGGTNRVHQYMVTVNAESADEANKIEDEIRAKFAVLHQFDPKDDQAIRMWNKYEEFERFQLTFAAIQGFIWFVGIGSIIAGVIGVSNIMLIIVKDRTREIGVRKALGATPRSIISMIMQEAIFLTSVSGYIGMLTGFGLIYGIDKLMETMEVELPFFYNPEVDFGAVMAALITLVICGALAGLIPALQAVKINPVEAMKS